MSEAKELGSYSDRSAKISCALSARLKYRIQRFCTITGMSPSEFQRTALLSYVQRCESELRNGKAAQ